MTLRIATDLALPADTVTSTLIVFGGKGMGKTNFGGVLVEELSAARLRWCVLDPLGVWWGLRHSVDGKGKGIECLILGGVNGDIPIEPTGGGVVADLVVDEDADVIIDFSRRPDGRMWSKGERIKFVTDYAVRLFQRQGELVDGQRRPPIFVVLDEAARYIPQMVRAGDKDIAACVGAWEDLVEEGRNVGIGVGLLTQRSARINKSVSELADALFAFRTVGPLSLGAITDWLGEHIPKERIRELSERVRSLDVGSALVVSPGWLRFEDVVHIRARATFDSSATPKAGDMRRVVGSGAKPDLSPYQERMAATIERSKANDPAELRKRITALERQLAEKPVPSATPAPVIERIEVPVLNGEVGELRDLIGKLVDVGAEIEDAGSRIVLVGKEITAAIGRVQATPNVGQVERAPRGVSVRPARDRGDTAVATLAPAAPSRTPAPVSDAPVSLGKAERLILAALVAFPSGKPQKSLGVIAGYAWNGGGFNNAIGSLRSKGLIAGGRDLLTITGAGADAAASLGIEPLPRGPALYDHWMGQLGKAKRLILEALVAAYPDALARDVLGERTGYAPNGGGFNNALGHLRTLELIARSELRASADLF